MLYGLPKLCDILNSSSLRNSNKLTVIFFQFFSDAVFHIASSNKLKLIIPDIRVTWKAQEKGEAARAAGEEEEEEEEKEEGGRDRNQN